VNPIEDKPNGQPRRVLIIDDNHAVADSLALVLASRAFDARACHSAEEALHLAKDFHPHLVLTDVMMEELTGIDVAAYFAEADPKCRVVLMSGQNDAAPVLLEGLNRGLRLEIIAKPFHPDELLALLDSSGRRQ
jgi:DNA-binding response OmpR family regulator